MVESEIILNMKKMNENLVLGQKEKTFTDKESGKKIEYKRYVLYVGNYVFDIHSSLSKNDKVLLAEMFEKIDNE